MCVCAFSVCELWASSSPLPISALLPWIGRRICFTVMIRVTFRVKIRFRIRLGIRLGLGLGSDLES